VSTWLDFGKEVFALAEKTWGGKPEIEAISTADYESNMKRPMNSVLNTETFEVEFGVKPRSMKLPLEDVILKLLKTKEDVEGVGSA